MQRWAKRAALPLATTCSAARERTPRSHVTETAQMRRKQLSKTHPRGATPCRRTGSRAEPAPLPCRYLPNPTRGKKNRRQGKNQLYVAQAKPPSQNTSRPCSGYTVMIRHERFSEQSAAHVSPSKTKVLSPAEAGIIAPWNRERRQSREEQKNRNKVQRAAGGAGLLRLDRGISRYSK